MAKALVKAVANPGLKLHRLAEEKFSPRDGRAIRADALSGMRQFPGASFAGVVMMSYLEHEPSPRQALPPAHQRQHVAGGGEVKTAVSPKK